MADNSSPSEELDQLLELDRSLELEQFLERFDRSSRVDNVSSSEEEEEGELGSSTHHSSYDQILQNPEDEVAEASGSYAQRGNLFTLQSENGDGLGLPSTLTSEFGSDVTSHYTACNDFKPLPSSSSNVTPPQLNESFQPSNAQTPSDLLMPSTSLASTRGQHRAIRSSPRHYCDMCDKSFTRDYDLNRHRKSKHPSQYDPGRPYTCICGREGIRRDNYIRHLNSCRRTGPSTRYKCKCGNLDVDKGEHEEHIKTCQADRHGRAGEPKANPGPDLPSRPWSE